MLTILTILGNLDSCSRDAEKNVPIEEKGPEATGTTSSRSKKAPPAAKRTPPPLPPPTRPDEQLYWLDLTIDHRWDLRLNKPFDRAVGGEVRHILPDVGRSGPPTPWDEFDTETHSRPGGRWFSRRSHCQRDTSFLQ